MGRFAIATAVMMVASACASRAVPALRPAGAFNPSQSDPAALATVAASMTALAGSARWDDVKELRFELRYHKDGKVLGDFKHHIDRWNGRHQLRIADPTTLGGPPEMITWMVIKYDLFNGDKLPYASVRGRACDDDTTREYVRAARQRLADDSFLLTLIYRLNDPGVHLRGSDVHLDHDVPDLCSGPCAIVDVTFDADPARGTWLVAYDQVTHLPRLVGQKMNGGVAALRIGGWTEAGGMRWPTRFSNIGPGEQEFEFAEVGVGEPRDADYEPPIGHWQGDQSELMRMPEEATPHPKANGCDPAKDKCHDDDDGEGGDVKN